MLAKVVDSCPEWADQLLVKLYQVEVFLGNIPSGMEWGSQYLSSCFKRTFERSEETFREEHAEAIFKQVVRKLSDEGYALEEIVGFINLRIKCPNCPPYCSKDEAAEALATS